MGGGGVQHSLPPFLTPSSPNILLGLCLGRINHIIGPFVSCRLSAIDFASGAATAVASRCRLRWEPLPSILPEPHWQDGGRVGGGALSLSWESGAAPSTFS